MSLKYPVSLIKLLGRFALAATALPMTFATEASATGVTLGWDAGPETNLQGYRVHSGTKSGEYNKTYEAGLATSIPIDQLDLGQTYYFTVIAIGSTGLESPQSTELVVTLALPPLPSGGTLALDSTGGLCLQWSFPAPAISSSPEFIVEASPDLVAWTEVATVLPEASTHGDDQLKYFSWPISTTGGRVFYRMTARNWLGQSVAP